MPAWLARMAIAMLPSSPIQYFPIQYSIQGMRCTDPLKCRNAFQALHNLTCCLGFQVDSQPGNTPTSASCRRRRFQVPAPLSIHLVIRYSLLSRFDRPWAIGQQIVPSQVRIISCLPVSATRHHLERASELQGDGARVPPPQGAVA